MEKLNIRFLSKELTKFFQENNLGGFSVDSSDIPKFNQSGDFFDFINENLMEKDLLLFQTQIANNIKDSAHTNATEATNNELQGYTELPLFNDLEDAKFSKIKSATTSVLYKNYLPDSKAKPVNSALSRDHFSHDSKHSRSIRDEYIKELYRNELCNEISDDKDHLMYRVSILEEKISNQKNLFNIIKSQCVNLIEKGKDPKNTPRYDVTIEKLERLSEHENELYSEFIEVISVLDEESLDECQNGLSGDLSA